jgi:hypothetical protein
MKVKPKSVLIGLLVVFAIYAIIVSPQTAADYVRAAFLFLAGAVRSIFTFFDALLNR